jgi:hypothetical protein
MIGLPWIQLSQLPVLPSSKSTSFIIFQFYSFLSFVEQDEVKILNFSFHPSGMSN